MITVVKLTDGSAVTITSDLSAKDDGPVIRPTRWRARPGLHSWQL